MTLLPIVERELRSESHRSTTYWIRFWGAAGLLAVFVWYTFQHGLLLDEGGRHFAFLQFLLFLGIWVFAPLLTADCISRERREETLGLLFLTPLKSWEVVLAKGLAHGLRAGMLVLAVLPILIIPVLLGGVSKLDIFRAILLDAGALVLALSVGVFASCWFEQQWRNMATALALSTGGALLFSGFYAVGRTTGGFRALQDYNAPDLFRMTTHYLGRRLENIDSYFDQSSFYSTGTIGWPWRSRPLFFQADPLSVKIAAILFLFAIVVAIAVFWFASRKIKFAWQQQPLSAAQQQLYEQLCEKKLLRSAFRRRSASLLKRNPVAWLQGYSTGARTVKWMWCLYVISVVTLSLHPQLGLLLAPGLLVLVGGLAFSASRAFSVPRYNGTLELLLITPLTVRKLVTGTFGGLCDRHGWVFAILWLAAAFWNPEGMTKLALTKLALAFVGLFTSVTLIGMYLSLRLRNSMTAALITLAIALLEICIWALTAFYHQKAVPGGTLDRCVMLLALQLILSVAFWVFLEIRLTKRDFLNAPQPL